MSPILHRWGGSSTATPHPPIHVSSPSPNRPHVSKATVRRGASGAEPRGRRWGRTSQISPAIWLLGWACADPQTLGSSTHPLPRAGMLTGPRGPTQQKPRSARGGLRLVLCCSCIPGDGHSWKSLCGLAGPGLVGTGMKLALSPLPRAVCPHHPWGHRGREHSILPTLSHPIPSPTAPDTSLGCWRTATIGAGSPLGTI